MGAWDSAGGKRSRDVVNNLHFGCPPVQNVSSVYFKSVNCILCISEIQQIEKAKIQCRPGTSNKHFAVWSLTTIFSHTYFLHFIFKIHKKGADCCMNISVHQMMEHRKLKYTVLGGSHLSHWAENTEKVVESRYRKGLRYKVGQLCNIS